MCVCLSISIITQKALGVLPSLMGGCTMGQRKAHGRLVVKQINGWMDHFQFVLFMSERNKRIENNTVLQPPFALVHLKQALFTSNF